jgi:hypothetical protein
MLTVQRLALPLIVVLALSAAAVWHVAMAQEKTTPGAVPNGVLAVQPKASPAVQKWEYQKVNFYFEDKSLNDLGDEGWELVAVAPNSHGQHVAYFKRRK